MAQLVEGGHLTLADLREAEELLGRLESGGGVTDESDAGASQSKDAAKGSDRTGDARERGRRR